MMRPLLVALTILAGCDGPGTIGLLDTGWFDDSDVVIDSDEPVACVGKVVELEPAVDAQDWFWRNSPQIFVDTVGDMYDARLTDLLGRPVDTELVVVDDVGLKIEVQFSGGLAPNADYVLEVDDCFGTHTVPFRTSTYGTPLSGGPSRMIGHTYQLDLVNATWIEPGGFGPILATSFTNPVLIGVQFADSGFIDLIGATGYIYNGAVRQDRSFPTWEFPVSDFTGAPYFNTSADAVELIVSGYQLPIADFVLSGTLSADGSSFVGGTLSGLGDTRYAGGVLFQPNNPAAMCELAGGVGVQCVECADGEPYCLDVQLEALVGTLVDGLTLGPVLPEE
jgi:hypothetical protein